MLKPINQSVCRWALIITVVLAGTLGGCAPYQLQGLVIEGEHPGIAIVDKSDPRLERFGVPNVAIDVTLDPEKLNAKSLGKAVSDEDGNFALPIDEPGAGMLIYDIQVDASRSDFRSVTEFLRLPGSNQRLLVTMKIGKETNSKSQGTYLEQTLRDAKPYLDP